MTKKDQSDEDYQETYRSLIEDVADAFGKIVEAGDIGACQWLSLRILYVARSANVDLGLVESESVKVIH